MTTTLKTCIGCKEDKPREAFSSRPRTKGGRYARCKDCERAQQRDHYARHTDEMRPYKADQMRKRRRDPLANERIRVARAKKYVNGGRERQQAYMARFRERRFFHWRARLWHHHWNVEMTAVMLARLWRSQRGRCALSGRKLGRDAQLDHIVHISANGSHTIDNLRWLDPAVNAARGSLDDAAFLALCREVIAATS